MRYQLHRPKELGNQVISRMIAVAFKATANTAGPVLVNGKPIILTQAQVDRLFEIGETSGARPCRRDVDTGYIHLGHYVFVPEVSR